MIKCYGLIDIDIDKCIRKICNNIFIGLVLVRVVEQPMDGNELD